MTAPKILSVDDILAAPDLPEETVEVPEWGGAVVVRGLTRQQAFEVRADGKVGKEMDVARVDMLMLIAGMAEPKFTAEQGPQLMAKSAAATQRVVNVINRLSGMDEEAAAAADRSFPS